MGRNPVAGDPLGLAYPAYKAVAERVAERTAALDPTLGPAAPRGRGRADRGPTRISTSRRVEG